VITGFWGLESDFGANQGKDHSIKSLATLAYDCRRSERFQNETIAALKVIDRGDLAPDEMVGSWAGELGQTQFLPTHYFTYAVDYDGDGRRDLEPDEPPEPRQQHLPDPPAGGANDRTSWSTQRTGS